jgi:hypothetical protein
MLETGNVRNPIMMLYTGMTAVIGAVRGARTVEKTRCEHADDEEVQDAEENLAEAQARLKLAQAEQKVFIP